MDPLNLVFRLGKGETAAPDDMQEIINRADAGKLEKPGAINRCPQQGRNRAVGGISAVRFTAVLHAGNLNGVLVLEIEEHPVIAAAEAKASPRRLELFHVAGARLAR